jgi:DNA repair protein RadC
MVSPDGEIPGEFNEDEIEKIRAIAKLSGSFIIGSSRQAICNASDIVPLVADMKYLSHEEMRIIIVDGGNNVLTVNTISVGGANIVSYGRDKVLREVLSAGGRGFFLVHNHPGGSSEPSKEDIVDTRDMRAAASIIGLELLDSCVISRTGFSSIRRQHPEIF